MKIDQDPAGESVRFPSYTAAPAEDEDSKEQVKQTEEERKRKSDSIVQAADFRGCSHLTGAGGVKR